VFALTPALWTMKVISIVRWALAPLAPSVQPAPFAGRLVTDLPVPLGFAPTWFVLALPAATLASVLVGLGLLCHRALARRFAGGRLRPTRDRTALGSVVALGLLLTLIGPACVPAPLAVFPPDVAAALPFAAIAAALGLERVAHVAHERRPLLPLGVTLGLLAWVCVARPETASASFDDALGATRAVARTGWLPLGDGSELASVGPAIESLSRAQVTIHAPEVPGELWQVLKRVRRLKTNVVPVATGELQLVRGGEGGAALWRLERSGAVLWTLRKVR